jgi:hypothetical protein
MSGARFHKPRARDKKAVPEWIHDWGAVQAFLKARFPQLRIKSTRDYEQAHKWLAVIVVWRGCGTQRETEKRNGWGAGTLSSLAQQIRWASAGLRLDGKTPTGRRRGRPKKMSIDLNNTSVGEEA